MVEVCKIDVEIRGTSAKLREADLLSVKQLLYGSVDPRNNRLVDFWRSACWRIGGCFGLAVACGGLEIFMDCGGNMHGRVLCSAVLRQGIPGFLQHLF